MPVFLDPTNDIAFKKIFGNQNKKEILINFLNNVLERAEGEKIVSVTINDPNNYPEFVEPSKDSKQKKLQYNKSKYSIVDVSATDQSGKHYIIEVQVSNQEGYGARAQYYSSVAVARQLNASENYLKLTPVIFIGVLCFDLFEDKDYLSHHVILNKKTHSHGLRLMEWHFIELQKFTKELNELKNVIDEWCYFLKNIKAFSEMPIELQHTKEIRKAMEIINEATWSAKELYDYEKQRDAILSEKGRIAASRAEGMAEGIIQGKTEGKAEIIQKLLSKFNEEEVANITGLPRDEIKKMKK